MQDPKITIKNGEDIVFEMSLWNMLYLLIYEQRINPSSVVSLFVNDEEVDKPPEIENQD